MTITIESTNLTTQVRGVTCRIWRGRTSSGVDCDLAIPVLRAARKPIAPPSRPSSWPSLIPTNAPSSTFATCGEEGHEMGR